MLLIGVLVRTINTIQLITTWYQVYSTAVVRVVVVLFIRLLRLALLSTSQMFFVRIVPQQRRVVARFGVKTGFFRRGSCVVGANKSSRFGTVRRKTL